jgi:hypothetical protein
LGKEVLHVLLSFLVLTPAFSFCQTEPVGFNNNVELKEGIYTSYREVLRNAPAFPDCMPHVEKMLLDTAYYNYIDADSVVHEYYGNMFAFVQNGSFYIGIGNGFYKVGIKGAVTVFYKVKNYYIYQANYTLSEDKIYIVDFLTGSVKKLNPDNLERILLHDELLYIEFNALSPAKKRKSMLPYILKYNQRNTVYME